MWGPSSVNNISSARWFITFIDDHTCVCYTYLFKYKSDAAKVFQNFHKMVQNQFKKKFQVPITKNVKEYHSEILGKYIDENAIIHETSSIGKPNKIGWLRTKKTPWTGQGFVV